MVGSGHSEVDAKDPQWKGAVVGFEQVLKYSIVAWAILRLGMSLVGRTRHVTKTKIKNVDAVLIKMVATQNGSATSHMTRHRL